MTATATRSRKTAAPATDDQPDATIPPPPADDTPAQPTAQPADLVEAIKAKQAAALDGYEQLVKQAAAGSPTDADEAVRTLFAAGKTADDLSADIEAHRRRVELRAVADQVPAVEAEMARLIARQADLDGRRAAALAGFDQEGTELSDRRNEAIERLREVKSAERQLQHTCTGPRRDRLTKATRMAEQATARLAVARRAVADTTRLIEQVRSEPNKHQVGEAGRLAARLARAEATAADAEREAATASAERGAAFAACLQP